MSSISDTAFFVLRVVGRLSKGAGLRPVHPPGGSWLPAISGPAAAASPAHVRVFWLKYADIKRVNTGYHLRTGAKRADLPTHNARICPKSAPDRPRRCRWCGRLSRREKPTRWNAARPASESNCKPRALLGLQYALDLAQPNPTSPDSQPFAQDHRRPVPGVPSPKKLGTPRNA